jgi:hypothetical protein
VVFQNTVLLKCQRRRQRFGEEGNSVVHSGAEGFFRINRKNSEGAAAVEKKRLGSQL